MPQLDVSSFLSQIFWLVIFFAILFIVAKNVIVPNMERILSNRANHINSMLEQAKQFTAEAAQVDREVIAELEAKKMQLKLLENEQIAAHRNETEKLLEELSKRNAAKSAEAVDKINRDMTALYNDIKKQMPELLDQAYRKIYSK